VGALRGTELITGVHGWPTRVPIPDLIPKRCKPEVRIVIKSVSSMSRVRLFLEAWPDSRAIVIMRHPCAQVSSSIRGIELGKLDPLDPPGEVLRGRESQRLGLWIEKSSTLSTAERLAWEWAYYNQRLIDDLSDFNRAKIVTHSDLVADPIGVAR